jgi:hypothetical protein
MNELKHIREVHSSTAMEDLSAVGVDVRCHLRVL